MKRTAAFLLALVMLTTVFAVAAFADGSEGIVASVLESEELKYGDFSTLEAALNVAKNIPDCTVKLLNDTELDDDILIDSGEFTIDWNGCTVGSADISFAGTAKITMTDSNPDNGNSIESWITIEKADNLKIVSGNYEVLEILSYDDKGETLMDVLAPGHAYALLWGYRKGEIINGHTDCLSEGVTVVEHTKHEYSKDDGHTCPCGAKDDIAPKAKISFKDYTYEYGSFFAPARTLQFNGGITVNVSAKDEQSGIDTVKYLFSKKVFATEAEAISASGWLPLELDENGTGSIKVNSKEKIYVYVMVTDNSGNITVINTDGIITNGSERTETIVIPVKTESKPNEQNPNTGAEVLISKKAYAKPAAVRCFSCDR